MIPNPVVEDVTEAMKSHPEYSDHTKVFQVTDGNTYVLSIKRPYDFATGENDLEIYLHQRVSMMDWPAHESFEVTFTPWMDAMGHGSTGNTDPAHTADGLYRGTFNASMGGEWTLNFELNENGTQIIDEVNVVVNV